MDFTNPLVLITLSMGGLIDSEFMLENINYTRKHNSPVSAYFHIIQTSHSLDLFINDFIESKLIPDISLPNLVMLYHKTKNDGKTRIITLNMKDDTKTSISFEVSITPFNNI